MSQTADPVALALTGEFPFVLLLATLLTLLVSLCLLRLYRHAVLKSMRTRANRQATTIPETATPRPPDPLMPASLQPVSLDHTSSTLASSAVEALYATVLQAPWRTAALYAVAGFGYALLMTVNTFLAGRIEFLPVRFLLNAWTYAWPVVLTTNLVAASSQRTTSATTSLYFLVLLALGALVVPRSTNLTWLQVGGLWLIVNLIPTVLLLAVLNRRVRAVGPMVLSFMLVACMGSSLALSTARYSEGVLDALAALGLALNLSASATVMGLSVLGFAVFGAAGWLLLRWIRARYERKRISDQSLIIDSIWLVFASVQSVPLVFEGAAWILSGLGAFLLFKAIVAVGFFLRDRSLGATSDSPRLLLLRVFSLGWRSERLFGLLAKHWRYVGSTQLIVGPDLAMATIEPQEFLDFLSGKLARRFIDGPQTLNLRLSEMDMEPDQDGRFRVNGFFCHDDTWQMALRRLVGESDAVLMDLRSFSPQNAGCVFEIDELVNVVPLERVVFIIDQTTDEQFLHRTVRQSWDQMRTTSPNRLSPSPQLRFFQFTGSHEGELRQLLHAVCRAAKAGPLQAI